MKIPEHRQHDFMNMIMPEPNTGCWLWEGALSGSGYGRFSVFGVLVQAHRVSYLMHVGQIPDGLQLDHLCRVRSCVNPQHLEPVTNRENSIRADAGKNNREKTHCKNGHPFNDQNTAIRKTGTGLFYRQCKICHCAAVMRHTRLKKTANDQSTEGEAR